MSAHNRRYPEFCGYDACMSADAGTHEWPPAAKVDIRWTPEDERAWRRLGTSTISATLPPEIAAIDLPVPSAVATITAAADSEMAALDGWLSSSDGPTLDAVAAHLLRAESLSSSRIEGLGLSARRLAEAEFTPSAAKRLAVEVTANVHAMQAATALGIERHPLTVADLCDLHAILMRAVPGIEGGQLRTVQNWIGSSNVPTDAEYVPPPPTEIGRLLDDLVTFANRRDLSVSFQAAIAHAQFEGIHPFVEGNGRVGRCLIGVIVRKRTGLSVLPPVSAEFRRDTTGYFAALQAHQQDSNPWPWVTRFGNATIAACATARRSVDAVNGLLASWRERVGRQRKGSILERLIDVLPSHTMLDSTSVATLLGVDPDTARRGLAALETAGIVRQVSAGRRNRVWRVDDMHDLLDSI